MRPPLARERGNEISLVHVLACAKKYIIQLFLTEANTLVRHETKSIDSTVSVTVANDASAAF